MNENSWGRDENGRRYFKLDAGEKQVASYGAVALKLTGAVAVDSW